MLDEYFQLGKDGIADVAAQPSQAIKNRCTSSWPLWVERYRKAGVEIHSHGTASALVGEAGDFSAILKRAATEAAADMMDIQGPAVHLVDAHAGALEDRPGNKPLPVPVHNSEIVNDPQFVSLGVGRSVIRLESLDNCLGFRVNASNLEPSAGTGRSTWILGVGRLVASHSVKDRKLRPRWGFATASRRGEHMGKLVERRSKALANVANENFQPLGGTSVDECSVYLLSVRFALSHNTIRFSP